MTDGQVLALAGLIIAALCWAIAAIVREEMNDRPPGETPEERQRRRHEEYVMRDPHLRKMRMTTLALQETAAKLEARAAEIDASNASLANDLTKMKAIKAKLTTADDSLHAAADQLDDHNAVTRANIAKIRAANDRIRSKLIRAQDIDLDASAEIIDKAMRRDW